MSKSKANKNELPLSIKVDYGMFKGLDALVTRNPKECRLTQPTLVKILGWKSNHASRLLNSAGLKYFAGERFTPPTLIKAVDSLGRVNTFSSLPIDYCSVVVRWQTKQGNEQALDLLVAAFLDSFKSIVFEQAGIEYHRQDELEKLHQWNETRPETKSLWKELVAATDYYFLEIDGRPHLPPFVHESVANAINRGLFGKDAKTIRKETGADSDELIRDYMGLTAISRIKTIEELAVAKILYDHIKPVQAVKDAIAQFHYEPIDYNS